MNVNPVSANNLTLSKKCAVPAFGDDAKKDEKPVSAAKPDTADKLIKKIENMPPAAVGLGSAVLWFGIGMGFDRLLGVAFKSMKSSLKSSLTINGIFGAVMGIASYFKAKKES